MIYSPPILQPDWSEASHGTNIHAIICHIVCMDVATPLKTPYLQGGVGGEQGIFP